MRTERIACEAAGDLAALDPLHDEERPAKLRALPLQRHGARHRHHAGRALIGAKLGFAFRVDQALGRLATEDQPVQPLAVMRIEAIGFAARPARDPRQ